MKILCNLEIKENCIVISCLSHNTLKNKLNNFILENKMYKKSISNYQYYNVVIPFRATSNERGIFDLRKKLKDISALNTICCSFEIMRAKSNDFYQSYFAEMNKYHPLFYALTSSIKNRTQYHSSLDMFNKLPSNTLLHLPINDLTETDVQTILNKALDCGIHNIFALRGDSTSENNIFPHTVDLVRFIRKQFGDTFCICVAGFPEMHPESPSKEMDLLYLKEKVDAGADFIITQFFFEANVFIKFVNDCRKVGINISIIPGILPFSSYAYLEKMCKICNVKVPQNILNTLQLIKGNDDEVYNYGIKLSIDIIKTIIASKTTCGFHFYTLNKPSLTSEICDRLDIFH
ncbi:5,10-methylenetetrahydrofolate reductase isoform X2 [Xylocopa sonorina]|uniref:5,10-methylenetetrahydrofolate reductase isoform X2 n=1 Tax=Xylocopa sonorina TaxID=1818115 RepID=UPI00403AED8C